MEYPYVDFGFQSVSARYIIAKRLIGESIAKAENKSHYVSWYRFPRSVYEAQTTKNYKGPCICDYLPFDFDNADNPEASLHEGRKFVASLGATFGISPEVLSYFFSGKKGFHILIPLVAFGEVSPSANLPDAMKKVAVDLIGELDADTKIYDRQRLLRVENTRHADSGLYRIPLTKEEFLTLDFEKLKELAKSPRTTAPPKTAIPCPILIDIYQKHIHGRNEPMKTVSGDIYRGGLTEGNGRDEAAFRLVCDLRDKNVPASAAIQILQLWDGTNRPPLTETDGEGILERKIANAYGESEIGSGITSDMIKNSAELAEEYTQYINQIKTKKITLGFPKIDKIIRGLVPGEVLFVIAKSGVGKTAFLQAIQRNLTCNKQISLFFSLEQPLVQCFERSMQMVHEMAGYEIESAWSDQEQRPMLMAQFANEFSYAYTIAESIKVEDIPDAVRITEERAGQGICCQLIDYMGYLNMPEGRSLYEKVSIAARALKSMAKKTKIPIICAVQVSRDAGDDGTKPLSIGSARDSGAIEESADILLGIHNTFVPEDRPISIFQTIQVLKNRKGYTGEVKMEMICKSLRWKEL